MCAPTGSGKTLAYALPVVQALLPRVVPRLRALVLLPTRALAAQVHCVFEELCRDTPLRVGLAAGHDGLSFERERASLLHVPHGPLARPSTYPAAWQREGRGRSAVDILVATPGRLVEHLRWQQPLSAASAASASQATASQDGFTLAHLRLLVVDEADRLLSHGFQNWLPAVLDATHSDAPPHPLYPASCPHAPRTAPHAQPASGSGDGSNGGGGGGGSNGSRDTSELQSPADLAIEPRTRRHKLGSAPALARSGPLLDPPMLKLLFSATLTRSAAKLAPLRLARSAEPIAPRPRSASCARGPSPTHSPIRAPQRSRPVAPSFVPRAAARDWLMSPIPTPRPHPPAQASLLLRRWDALPHALDAQGVDADVHRRA